MDNGSNPAAAPNADNAAQIANSAVHDMALNNEATGSHPMPARINAVRATGSQAPNVSGQGARDQSISSRISRGRLGLRTSNRDSHDARSNVSRPLEENVRKEMDAAPPIMYMSNYHPFVENGYAELNPEYAQSQNSRPVWSLAKPLPRVVRESAVETGGHDHDHDHEESKHKEGDVEAGKVPAKPKPKSKLELEREAREHAFFCKKHGRFHDHGGDDHACDDDDDHGHATSLIREISLGRTVSRVQRPRRSHEIAPQPGEPIGLAKPFGDPHRHE